MLMYCFGAASLGWDDTILVDTEGREDIEGRGATADWDDNADTLDISREPVGGIVVGEKAVKLGLGWYG